MNKAQFLEITKRLELSQRKIAELVGCSSTNVYHIIHGKQEPSKDFLTKFEKGLKAWLTETINLYGKELRALQNETL